MAEALGLQQKLLYSKAGRLIEALDSLESNLSKEIELNLPQILVIGDEKQGKSTLLERIVMHEVFPKAEGLCTRMPIKFCLKHLNQQGMSVFATANNLPLDSKYYVRLHWEGTDGNTTSTEPGFCRIEDLETEVKKYMDKAVEFRNQKLWGIVEDVLKIEILSPDVPNLVLIDLPGIMSAHYEDEPQDIRDQSIKLISNYLRKDHVIILAVVGAHFRIRNSSAMLEIQKHKKENMTVGVLTMADKAIDPRNPDPYHNLKAKLDGTASDVIKLPSGYIAVKNRDTTYGDDLVKIALEENKWFDTHLPGYRKRGLASSDCLVETLMTRFANYIQKVWAPSAKEKLTFELRKKQSQLGELGFEPLVGYDWQGKLVEILKEFHNNWHSLSTANDKSTSTLIKNVLRKIQDTINACKEKSSGANFNNLSMTNALVIAKNDNDFYNSMVEAITTSIQDSVSELATDIHSVFTTTKSPTRMERFENLMHALSALITKDEATNLIQQATYSAIAKFATLHTVSIGDLRQLKEKTILNVQMVVLSTIFLKLSVKVSEVNQIMDKLTDKTTVKFLLEENEKFRLARKQLKEDIANITHALDQLEQIRTM